MKMKKHPYRTSGKYLLSGKIFCAACGSKVTRTSGKSCMGLNTTTPAPTTTRVAVIHTAKRKTFVQMCWKT